MTTESVELSKVEQFVLSAIDVKHAAFASGAGIRATDPSAAAPTRQDFKVDLEK
jgi:hypothetical protein